MDVHIETWKAETTVSNHESDWLSWINKAESMTGHSLDGDQNMDGYSMDEAYDAWQDGKTPVEYVESIVFVTHDSLCYCQHCNN